jgi:hypothetical protein
LYRYDTLPVGRFGETNMSVTAYHPVDNPGALPPVESVADVDRLPWAGNHWWDFPIMTHVERVVLLDESKPIELRKAITERAGYLMTGEDCTMNDIEFGQHLRVTREWHSRRRPNVGR